MAKKKKSICQEKTNPKICPVAHHPKLFICEYRAVQSNPAEAVGDWLEQCHTISGNQDRGKGPRRETEERVP